MPTAKRRVASGSVVKRYLCDHCGFTANARIRALGLGAGLTGSIAEDSARDAHTDDALRTLALTPCPQCGRRQRSMARELVATLVLSAVFAAIIGALSVLLSLRGMWPFVGTLAAIAVYVGLRLRRASRAAHRVEFVVKK